MPDIIQVLPDHVANQIAAGEVVQRPASAVKEMLENALDAGASKIHLLVKDAGKALIQVMDNGSGMSATDARMCFERHATSKIRKADDLFAIRTMGFRGEALASIAAIAQVELKTKKHDSDIGTVIQIDGSEVLKQEPEAIPAGTSIAVKNLFYNVPARRNFLKSNPIEFRHIVDEFDRVALANPEVHFILTHDQQEIYNLPKGNLKQRIVNLLGRNYESRIVPVEETTPLLSIKGYVGKPEFAKKTRGEQYLFVNNRFIKNAYLHHAIASAYESMLPTDSHPLYILFLEVDPKIIDVNVHPTKTEIKFEDERNIYAIVRATVKKGLGWHNISPSIDFDQNALYNSLVDQRDPNQPLTSPKVNLDPNFDPFKPTNTSTHKHPDASNFRTGIPNNWDTLYQISSNEETQTIQSKFDLDESESNNIKSNNIAKSIFQLHRQFIVSSIKSGLMIIDQHLAHERILYEKTLVSFQQCAPASQQCLFPKTMQLSASDYHIFEDIRTDLHNIGFEIRSLGNQSIVIDGIPVECITLDEQKLLESIFETYRTEQQTSKLNRHETLARSIAKSLSIKHGKELQLEEMQALIDDLFACGSPNFSVNGKPIFVTFALDEILQKFR